MPYQIYRLLNVTSSLSFSINLIEAGRSSGACSPGATPSPDFRLRLRVSFPSPADVGLQGSR